MHSRYHESGSESSRHRCNLTRGKYLIRIAQIMTDDIRIHKIIHHSLCTHRRRRHKEHTVLVLLPGSYIRYKCVKTVSVTVHFVAFNLSFMCITYPVIPAIKRVKSYDIVLLGLIYHIIIAVHDIHLSRKHVAALKSVHHAASKARLVRCSPVTDLSRLIYEHVRIIRQTVYE